MRWSFGNMLEQKEGILVHGCNAQGVMGSGVAKAIRDTYPQAYDVYRAAYENHGLHVGQVIWAPLRHAPPKFAIANAITQDKFGRDPSMRYVDPAGVKEAFMHIMRVARTHNLPVHFPAIGAGLGNGDWKELSRIIHDVVGDHPHTLWLLPQDSASSKLRDETYHAEECSPIVQRQGVSP